MFKTILIKILFRLLDVDLKTRNIVPFDDLKSIAGEARAREVEGEFRKQKYVKALTSVYHTQYFTEWLYLQVVSKRNEHIKTIDKEKRNAQRAAMLTFLKIIEELREANRDYIKLTKRNN